MKPIIEARAKEQQLRKPESVSEISHEQTPAIRTDEAVANLASISSNTIRKIEQIEQQAAPEVKQWAAAGDVSINLAAQFIDLPVEAQQEAIAAIAEHHDVHRHARVHGAKQEFVLRFQTGSPSRKRPGWADNPKITLRFTPRREPQFGLTLLIGRLRLSRSGGVKT